MCLIASTFVPVFVSYLRVFSSVRIFSSVFARYNSPIFRHIVTHRSIATQRLSKHFQTNTRPTIHERWFFYVVPAETVARRQPARQWTGWVAITWEPQQTRMQQYKNCVFCAWSVPRGNNSVVHLQGVVEREWEWSESSAVKEEGFGWRLIVSYRNWLWLREIVKESVNKSSHPIQDPLLLVTQP
jgi:hypothetical protein